jgi:hypothetical protein
MVGEGGLSIPSVSASNSLGRPIGAKTKAIRAAVLDLADAHEVMTVRQIFYALTVLGVIPKDENTGYRPVQQQVLKMRHEGLLPWSFIADGTRWQRKPTTYDSADDALLVTARTYRRNLWRSQNARIEVWLEKDALAGVVREATEPWDVALMVSRGTSSATFLHAAAEAATGAFVREDVTTYIYAMYDFDAAGERAARAIQTGFERFAPNVPIEFERIAVTREQIAAWALPTRPAKKTDPEAHKFGAEAVELDAIPPDKLIALVNDTIVGLVEPIAWERERAAEESERSILYALASKGVAA